MSEQFHNWYSSSLGRDIQLLEFGHGGQPIIIFPSSMGRYFEAKDRGLVGSAQWLLDQGKIRIFCPDSVDELSWYNKHVHPGTRAYNHSLYDSFILNELLPHIRHVSGYDKIITAGCSFGGYHAVNFAFRYPGIVWAVISMSGAFDIKDQVDGHYDDQVYYHNPVDYLPAADNSELWNQRIILGVGEHDICRGHNERLSQILHQKGINHWLDIRQGGIHDWPLWLDMFPHYLSTLV